ncbi:hypothetical protein V6N12_024088 [Hibiscus sabdariffa]|uniref:RNase H type-1 domain-containing protein n=1 Tax=Hibiscus sabdariffa TaxID=183260 RepID=A0ABR2FZR3_9ROSI
MLSHSILLHLSATNPLLPGFTRDNPGWSRSHDRAFSVRLAYELSCANVSSSVSGMPDSCVSPSHFANDLADWDLRFSAILWSLWLRLNALIFYLDNLDSPIVMDRSRRLSEDMQATSVSDCGLHVVHYSAGGQVPPPHATTRWGLIREHGGTWVMVFARSVGVCSPIEAELWAVHEGLVQAWVMGLKHVVVEVDSKLMLRLLSLNSRMVSLMTILHHIFALLSRNWSIKFVHSFREANVVVDKLTKSIALGSL